MGLGLEHSAQTGTGRPVDVGLPLDLARMLECWIFGGGRSSASIGRPLIWLRCGVTGRPVGFHVPDVQTRPVVRWLEHLPQLFFLFLALGVLAFLSMGFLLVPGHA